MKLYTAEEIRGDIKVKSSYQADKDPATGRTRTKYRTCNTLHTFDGKYTSDTDSDGYSYWYATDGGYRCGDAGYDYFFDVKGALEVLNKLIKKWETR